MWKKHQVVMLPTNEKAPIIQIIDKSLALNTFNINADGKDNIFQNLYILSDEEIKEGDWCINPKEEGYSIVFRAKGSNYNSLCKKIIACTDKSLKIIILRHNDFDSEWDLPEIPQSFIQHFVEQYNQGNIITEVMVEYEEVKYNSSGVPVTWSSESSLQTFERLKINADNTANIKPIKDSWSDRNL